MFINMSSSFQTCLIHLPVICRCSLAHQVAPAGYVLMGSLYYLQSRSSCVSQSEGPFYFIFLNGILLDFHLAVLNVPHGKKLLVDIYVSRTIEPPRAYHAWSTVTQDVRHSTPRNVS
jgi:hypothetical protein